MGIDRLHCFFSDASFFLFGSSSARPRFEETLDDLLRSTISCARSPREEQRQRERALTSSTTSPSPSSSASDADVDDGSPRTVGAPRAPGATGHAISVVEERTHAWPVTGQTPEPYASDRAARAPGGGGGPRLCCIFLKAINRFETKRNEENMRGQKKKNS